MQFKIQIDWVINSSDLLPNQWLNKKLGYVCNDFWCFKISKKPRRKLDGVIYAIERKKAVTGMRIRVKLQFSNPGTKLITKCVNTFHGSNTTLIGRLEHFIPEMFNSMKKIQITGGIYFHEYGNSSTFDTLSTDFSQLCCNQRFSDVIIRCGLEVFPAHKNILSARSSVFAEMLGNTPNDSKLSINDLEPTVMKAVLLYIYSGKTDLTTFQSTYDLLSAADRFCLNELKIIAINYIKRSLTVENVFECFYECKALQSYALEFMSKNFSLVKDTKQWEEFKQCRPDLITQLHEQSRKFFK